jgi:hypothetical protein
MRGVGSPVMRANKLQVLVATRHASLSIASMQLCNLLHLLSLFALGVAASRVVPCSRRSLIAGGLHLPSFSRFALVDADPTQAKDDTLAACELSREMLLRDLDPVKMQKLSAPLPTDFLVRRSAMEAGANNNYSVFAFFCVHRVFDIFCSAHDRLQCIGHLRQANRSEALRIRSRLFSNYACGFKLHSQARTGGALGQALRYPFRLVVSRTPTLQP